MNNLIKLNSDIGIDLPKLIDSRLLVQANSGGGKSWLIRRILEQSHGKVQQIILDPEGEFSTLREKYDYILAGKGGDTAAEPRSAALLARKLLELKVSAIIDLYELPPQERKRFVRLFLDAMVNSPKELWHDCLVVIDEAHIFVPEKGESEAASAVIDLATRGRKRGFCAILATQRISKLHKDAAAECNNKLIGRASQDIDRKRAGEELGFTRQEEFLSLRNLRPGEFFAFGPAISDDVQKVTVGTIHTSHPKAGSRALTSIVPPTERIRKILGNLADLPKEAEEEARTVDQLRRELSVLKRHKCPDKTLDQRQLQELLNERLQPHLTAFGSVENAYKLKLKEWQDFAKQLQEILKLKPDEKVAASYIPPKQIQSSSTQKAPPSPIISTPPNSDTLTGPEQRVLNAIAWMENVGIEEPVREIVAFLAGYAHILSKGFTVPCGALRTRGLISYPSPGKVAFTEAGRLLAHFPSKPGTTEQLHSMVLERLDGPKQRVLKPLLESYPQSMSADALCQAAGYMHPLSKGFTVPRGKLRTFGLIEYPSPGMVVASPILFLD